MRSLFNAAVYGLAAFSSAFPVFLLGQGGDLERITLYAFVGGALYVIVNVVLVCGALAILAGQPLRVLLRDNLGHSGPAFVIMAFLAALAASLWTTDPWLLVLLAGPLFTLTLYQRSALSTKVATRDALTDSLTGLGNHRSYQSRLRERSSGRRRRRGLALPRRRRRVQGLQRPVRPPARRPDPRRALAPVRRGPRRRGRLPLRRRRVRPAPGGERGGGIPVRRGPPRAHRPDRVPPASP